MPASARARVDTAKLPRLRRLQPRDSESSVVASLAAAAAGTGCPVRAAGEWFFSNRCRETF